MHNLFQIGYFKQTAMIILCGLLPIICPAQQRSKTDAILIAEKFANSGILSKSKRNIKLLQLSSSILPKKELQNGREAYFIFSTSSKDTGFVIVSGDERMPTILAYSDENSFDVNNIPSNVLYWLDCYTEAFLSLNESNDTQKSISLTINPNGVHPLINDNKWGQGDPYNHLCPTVGGEKCVTGCVATAMSQVMKYYGYPSIGNGSINYNTETNNITIQHSFNSIQFKWNDMLDDYSGDYTSAQADAVAELMFSCGASVKMDYCTSEQGGSGAYQKDLITAYIDNFNYDQDAAFMARNYCSVEDWHNLLIKELDEGRPVNYGGQSIRDGGHSFVLDGYRISDGNKYPDYHVNWGWKGKCNGYYQIADLHPIEDGQHATTGGFTSSQQMTIGIKPEDGIDDDHFYICTPNLYVSTATARPGSLVQVYSASYANFSYKSFSGTLHVALIPNNGDEEIILGEHKIRTLGYVEEQNNVSIGITIPSNLPEGIYTVQLRSKQSRKEAYNQVYSKKYPEITISNNGSIHPTMTDDAMLGCSELELENNSDPSLISLNIYELQNLLEAPFIGDLRMILADKQGKQLCAFGDSIQPGELSMYEIQEDPLKIQGKLIGTWPDGEYKLYIGARLINTSKYVYISFYDIAKPNMSNQELCLSAKIENGNLEINGRTFIIPTTTISNIVNETNEYKRVFGIDGKQISKPIMPGIYIINRKKVIRR